MTMQGRAAALKRELAPGERLSWQGSPRPRAELLYSGNWLFAVVWMMSSIGWMLLVDALAVEPRSIAGLARMEPDSLLPAVGLLALVIGTVMLTRPVRAAVRAGRTIYAITDRRLLRIEHGGRLRVLSIPLRRIDSVVGSRKTPGWGDIRVSTTTIQEGRPLKSGAFTLRGIPEVARAQTLLVGGISITPASLRG